MKTYYEKAAQAGRSMIEMLGVLAIVGILSAGGIAGYSMAMQSYKTNALIEKIQIIAQTARTLYKGNYEGISPQKLIDAGKITDVKNPFGNDLNIREASTSKLHFVIETTYNIPSDTCIDLLGTYWGDKGMFHAFYINDTNVYEFYPMEIYKAIFVCKGKDKKISLTFK